jgi:rubrerythrin
MSANQAGSGRRDDNDEDEIIPLLDLDLTCTACGRSFEPVSGESVCSRCTHTARPEAAFADNLYDDDATCRSCGHALRGLPRGTPCPECGHGRAIRPSGQHAPSRSMQAPDAASTRMHRRVEIVVDDLSTRSGSSSAAVAGASAAALACAGFAAALALSHWWRPSILEDWSIVLVWVLFTLAAGVLHLPGTLPAGRLPRWWGAIALGGAMLATAALVAYPLTQGIGGVALQALWDLLVIGGAIAYLIGLSVRVNAITEYAGQDPSERGFVSANAPFLGAIFIVANGFLLTWFFRRKLDFADAFALAVCFWMGWRLIALLWHTKNAADARAEATNRAERRQMRRGPATADPTDDAVCAACGHALRGLPRHARCPECGSHAR